MASLVVMGVSGCGKSHIGAAVATRLGLPLIEGDEFHGEANRALMSHGVALTDGDRAAWLQCLGEELARHPGGAVLTCSALRASYREQLRGASPGLRFAWLELKLEAALARVAGRQGHFFPPALVATQFATLEPPIDEPRSLRLDALADPDELVNRIIGWWREGSSTPATLRPRMGPV